MRLTGYSDRWSAAPGEAVTFYVSCLQPRYRAQLLRLIHGDNNPRGPGVKEVAIDHPVNGSYPGSGQPIFTGSYLVTDGACRFGGGGGLTLQTWIRPTLSHQDSQGIIGQWDAANHRGFLLLVRQGGIEAWIGVQGGEPLRLRIERPLHKLEWQFVSLVVDLAARRATLRHDLSAFDPRHSASATVDGVASGPIALADDCRITIGAGWLVSHGERVAPQACFNGRIEGPRLWGAALPPDAVEQLKTGASPAEAAKFLLAAWDFSHDPGGTRIPDRVDGRLDARSVNRPMRATSSHTWNPTIERFTDAPAAYNAIWFHEDDLADACWAPSFTLRVPESLPSGVYAVKIEGEDGARDYLPFIVRPPHGRATAPLAVLLPTVSYMAYANEALLELQQLTGMVTHANKWLHVEEYAYLNRHHLRSLYDHHRDGSGICYSSILRPVLTSFRPYHRCRSFDAPHQLSADLWLVDWLVQKGIPFDVITDHDLHREGVELLGRYRTVISGTHAEYTTTPMLDALHAYQRQGGRFICLSGNGFYWVTALDAQGQTVCEIRRANGSRTWAPEPGENHLSFTGEMGGTWRLRGRPPQQLTGVGTAGVGFDRGAPLRRSPASRDPQVAFIFEGVEEELIGDYPVLALGYGAAGFEIDRADVALGTPEYAVVVASSFDHGDGYQPAMEEAFAIAPNQGGRTNPNIRADMVFYDLPDDGAVFSVGAVMWCSALSYNNYDNSASRVLENVVRAFLREGPIRR